MLKTKKIEGNPECNNITDFISNVFDVGMFDDVDQKGAIYGEWYKETDYGSENKSKPVT